MNSPRPLQALCLLSLLAASVLPARAGAGIPTTSTVGSRATGQNLSVSLTTPGYAYTLVKNSLGTVRVIVDPKDPIVVPLLRARAGITPPNNTIAVGEPDPTGGTPTPAPVSFTATFAVTNGAKVPVPVTLSAGAFVAAQNRITFHLYDSTGALLWTSPTIGSNTGNISPTANPIASTSLIIPRRGAWRRTVQVPLQLDGKTLPDGEYRLDAETIGTPHFSTSTSFTVTNLLSGPIIGKPLN